VELRRRKNWTQEKLADKAIVSVRTVQNIERGRPTQRSTLARLSNALGVSARDLMLVVARRPPRTAAYRPSRRRMPSIFSDPNPVVASLISEAAKSSPPEAMTEVLLNAMISDCFRISYLCVI
jgi:transcriptional regulator with XRE-family HTH domain